MDKKRNLIISFFIALLFNHSYADGLFANAADTTFLNVDQAFQLSAYADTYNRVTLYWQIADGYYLYKKRLSVNSDNAQLGEIVLPVGKQQTDEFFGDVEIYEQQLEVSVPIINAGQTITLDVGYQGCAHAGLCYPPTTRTLNLELPSTQSNEPETANSINNSDSQLSQQDQFAQRLSNQNLTTVLWLFLLAGLLLAFTPCVFPMIPILSSIIAGQSDNMSAGRGFRLSLVYVLAMALTYTLAGILVGMTGANLQIWFQNPWIISSFALLFVILSLSMFGFYELQMPNALQSRLTAISSRQQNGSYVGAGIMGLLSALIVGPCVTAPLIGALIYIAETGDPVVGGLALFALSMGMGSPLLLIGTSAGKYLPKAGGWMEPIKAVFGVMLLALAIWFLERILEMPIILGLSGALLIGCAMFMGVFNPTTSAWARCRQTLAWLLLVYGTLLVIGASAGSHSLMKPLQNIFISTGESGSHKPHLAFEQIRGVQGLNAVLDQARIESKPVLLDFYADWCIACKELDAYTFTDAGVQSALNGFILIQTDVTENNQEDQELLSSLGLFGPPALLFYDTTGQEDEASRLVGFIEAPAFIQHIERFKLKL